MARRRHDSLSKDLLSLWLEPLGPVAAPRRVQGEERQIDLVCTPGTAGQAPRGRRRQLGLLGRMVRGLTAFEVFRNPCTADEVRSCVVKLVELHEELRRRARRRRQSVASVPLPHLWVLTPTLSPALLNRFDARPRRAVPPGCFALAPALGTTIVVVSRLDATHATLWLRLLGRGEVQRRAFDELAALPHEDPFHQETARRVLRWRAEASQAPSPSPADKELLMNSERLVEQWEQRLLRQGKAEGKASGRAAGEAAGKAAGKAEALLLILGARGLSPSAVQVGHILACRQPTTLERWLVLATTASTLDEVFAAPASKPPKSTPSAPRRARR
jgi:hypothetical protein